jgi:SAM-dependent methyltransferase
MHRGCCLCHPDAGAKDLFTATDPVTGDAFEIVSCTACGLARTEPQPTEAELDRYYPAGYHGAAKRYRFGLDSSLSMLHRGRIRRIERLAGCRGRVLDVGCGPGLFLDSMRRRGWQTRGTERSPEASRQAREALHLDVRAQDLGDLVAEGVSFDAVVLWHVAEHMHDPLSTLRNVRQLLRPGGALMVAVPDFSSPEARIGKAGWFQLDVPRHLFHFTPASLRMLLSKAELEPLEEVRLAPEYDVFSFVQTAENLLGLPPNLLYDVLRRPQARLGQFGAGALRAGVALSLAPLLALVGFVWTALAAALRQSATVTIYAQRPLGEAGAAGAS